MIKIMIILVPEITDLTNQTNTLPICLHSRDYKGQCTGCDESEFKIALYTAALRKNTAILNSVHT